MAMVFYLLGHIKHHFVSNLSHITGWHGIKSVVMLCFFLTFRYRYAS